MTERHGWRLSTHPLFLAQLERLLKSAAARPVGAADARLLAMLRVLLFDSIPADPQAIHHGVTDNLALHAQGWHCARFAGGRFGLFYQADVETRRIVYGWIADREAARLPLIRNESFILHGQICAVTQGGQMTVPQAAIDALGLRPGGQFAFRLAGDQCRLTRAVPPVAEAAMPAAQAPPAHRPNRAGLAGFPVHAIADFGRGKRVRRALQ